MIGTITVSTGIGTHAGA